MNNLNYPPTFWINKIKPITACLLILTLLVGMFTLPTQSAYAETPRRAVVTSLEGAVTVQAAGQAVVVPARLGMELKAGDRIITGKDGTLEIRFEDDSISRISPNSRVDVQDLYQDDDGSQTTRLNATWGKVWNKVQDVTGRNSRFEVNTPASVAGVRGTAFLVNADGNLVKVYEGNVGFGQRSDEDGSGTGTPPPFQTSTGELLIGPYQQAFMQGDGSPPPEPDPLNVLDIDSWEKDNLVEDVPIAYVEVETEAKTIQVSMLEEKLQQDRIALARLVKELEMLSQLLQGETDPTRQAELSALENQLRQEMELKLEVVRSADREKQELTQDMARLTELRNIIATTPPTVPIRELERQIREEARAIRQEDKAREQQRQEEQQARTQKEQAMQEIRQEIIAKAEELNVKDAIEQAAQQVTPELIQRIIEAQTQAEFEQLIIQDEPSEPEPTPAPPIYDGSDDDDPVVNAVISPTTRVFDKNVQNQADVTTTITWNSAATVTAVRNGTTALVAGTDYTVAGNTITIKKEYLATQAVGSVALTVQFNVGSAATLTVTVSDTTMEPEPVAPLDEPVAITAGMMNFAGDISVDLSNISPVPPEATLTVSYAEIFPESGSELTTAGAIVNFQFANITITEPVNILLPYNQDVIQENIAIYYYNEEVGRWEFRSSDVLDGVIKATVDKFSVYGVLSDTTPPANVRVEELSKTATTVTLSLSATDKSGIQKYEIYRDDLKLDIEPQGNNVTDPDLQPGTTYYYKIKAVDNLGNTSEFSNVLAVTTVQHVESNHIFFEDFEAGLGEWQLTGTPLWQVIENNSGIKNEAVGKFVNLADGDNSNGYLPNTPFGNYSLWYGKSEDSDNIYTVGNFINIQADYDQDWSGGTSEIFHYGSITSPVIQLPDISEGIAQLSFWSWWEIESVNPDGFDMMNVYVVTEEEQEYPMYAQEHPGYGHWLGSLNPEFNEIGPGGSPTLPYTSGGFNSPPTWREYSYDLAAFAGEEIRLRFEFNTHDQSYNGYRGWFIDNVEIAIGGEPIGSMPETLVIQTDYVPQTRHWDLLLTIYDQSEQLISFQDLLTEPYNLNLSESVIIFLSGDGDEIAIDLQTLQNNDNIIVGEEKIAISLEHIIDLIYDSFEHHNYTHLIVALTGDNWGISTYINIPELVRDNLGIGQAKKILQEHGDLSPREGLDSNVIMMIEALINSPLSGVEVRNFVSNNDNIGYNGEITYTTAEVEGPVTFNLNKGQGTGVQVTVNVKVPAVDPDVQMTVNPTYVATSSNFEQMFTLSLTNVTVAESVYASHITLGGVFDGLSIGTVSRISDTTVTAAVYGELTSPGVGTISLSADALTDNVEPLNVEVVVGTQSAAINPDTIDFDFYDTNLLTHITWNTASSVESIYTINQGDNVLLPPGYYEWESLNEDMAVLYVFAWYFGELPKVY